MTISMANMRQLLSENRQRSAGAPGVLAAASAGGVTQRRYDGGRQSHSSRSVGRVGAASWAARCSADRPDGVHSGCERQRWSYQRLDTTRAHAALGRRRPSVRMTRPMVQPGRDEDRIKRLVNQPVPSSSPRPFHAKCGRTAKPKEDHTVPSQPCTSKSA